MIETTKQYNISIKTHHCCFNINQAHRFVLTEVHGAHFFGLPRSTDRLPMLGVNHQQEGFNLIPPLATDMGTPATDI